jgi:hypothetical protein
VKTPLGTIKKILFKNRLAGGQDLQIKKEKSIFHLNSVAI